MSIGKARSVKAALAHGLQAYKYGKFHRQFNFTVSSLPAQEAFGRRLCEARIHPSGQVPKGSPKLADALFGYNLCTYFVSVVSRRRIDEFDVVRTERVDLTAFVKTSNILDERQLRAAQSMLVSSAEFGQCRNPGIGSIQMRKLFKKILCPIDPADNITTGVDVACSVAEGADATVCLLYVLPVVISSAPGVNPLPISESEAQALLNKIAHEHLEGRVRYEVYTKIGGEPARVILAAVEKLGVDSVVMATHGRKGLGRLVLGSVAERVVRESPCPVLSVRATPESR